MSEQNINLNNINSRIDWNLRYSKYFARYISGESWRKILKGDSVNVKKWREIINKFNTENSADCRPPPLRKEKSTRVNTSGFFDSWHCSIDDLHREWLQTQSIYTFLKILEWSDVGCDSKVLKENQKNRKQYFKN